MDTNTPLQSETLEKLLIHYWLELELSIYKEKLQLLRELTDSNIKFSVINNSKTIQIKFHEKHHEKITTFLEEDNITFHISKPVFKRPLKIVIKGLPTDFEMDKIKSWLHNNNIDYHHVSQLKSHQMDRHPLPLFLIIIKNSESNQENLYNLNQIEDFMIQFQKLRPKKFRQCYRCQNFNHSSFNCNFNAPLRQMRRKSFNPGMQIRTTPSPLNVATVMAPIRRVVVAALLTQSTQNLKKV